MLDLAIGDGAISPALRARFDGWRKALPRPLDATSHVANRDGKLVLAVPIPDANEVKGAYFYPAEHGVEFGRASCTERVQKYVSISVVAVTLKKNKAIIMRGTDN